MSSSEISSDFLRLNLPFQLSPLTSPSISRPSDLLRQLPPRDRLGFLGVASDSVAEEVIVTVGEEDFCSPLFSPPDTPVTDGIEISAEGVIIAQAKSVLDPRSAARNRPAFDS